MFGRKAARNALDGLFHGLKRGHGQVPMAAQERFPTADEIAADAALRFNMRGNPDGKILLGLVGAEMKQGRSGQPFASGGQFIGVADDRHVITVAGSRAGKGRSLLINNLLTWPGSVLVIDPKLDLATETAHYRATALRQNVHVLDPFGVAGPGCDSYRSNLDPLAVSLGTDADAAIDLAMLIADSLVVRAGREIDPHWNDAAQQMTEAVVLHCLTCPRYESRRTLRTVYELLMLEVESVDDNPSRLEEEMVKNEAFGGVVCEGATAFYDKSDRERSSVLSTIRRHLHFLVYPKIGEVLSQGNLDFARVQTEPTTIYAGVPATKMSSCAGFLRLVLNLALATFETSQLRREYQYQAGRLPVLIIMDEFASLGRMERVEAAAGQMAGFGVKLWPVLQDLSQIKSLTSNWETFLGNAGVLTFFGNTDLSTLDWIEKRLGQTTVYSPSHSEPTYDAAISGGATGSGYSLTTHPLMTGAEIARTFCREDPFARQLVMLPRGPMILQRAYYDQHEQIRRLLGR